MVVNRTGGLYFDGIDDFVDCGNKNILNITDEITLSAWVKIQHYKNYYNAIVAKSWNAYAMYVSNTKQLTFEGEINSNWTEIKSNSTLERNKWYNVIITYASNDNNGTMKLYINGVIDKEVNSLGGKLNTNNKNIKIGDRDQYWFKGIIDDVRIYNRALTAEEISRMYNENLDIREGLVMHLPMNEGTGNICYDTTRYGNNGTIHGARWVVNRI